MRILRYFLVGGAAAIVDVGLFSIFAILMSWPWIPVSVSTFIFATLVNYYLSVKFVFKSGIRYRRHIEIIGVFFVSGLALLVNQIVLYFAVNWIHLHLFTAKILATTVVFFWNYFGRSRLIF